ncbi:Uncharacterised protein [Mycobacteroides abscessus subsp. abscessus]|uniref:hypothetical protein n=1 Tax=Mycobacteroides abscessus TaxID=36809 RepID=UPI00092B8F17|nr:hypothetical protein [Mycobacteroides abscessus]SIG68503.1 Uncharacterised protein [Mycobacteroides abscessus subsp. abscessus]
MTDEAFVTDGAGTTSAPPPGDPQSGPAAGAASSPSAAADTGAPKPAAPPVAAAPDAADAAKSTPRVGTIANTIGAGVSKDLYKSPVDGVKGLFKAQYGAGSDLTGTLSVKLT